MNRCPDCAQLWADIDAALATHDPARIYQALRRYFEAKHKCQKCTTALISGAK